MSKLSNQPTFANLLERDPLLPPPTYESLIDKAGVKPGNIGKSWGSVNLDTSWDEALKITEEAAAKGASSNNALKNWLGGYAGLLMKNLDFPGGCGWKGADVVQH